MPPLTMGDQANDMITGYACHYCGMYFDKEDEVYSVVDDHLRLYNKMPKGYPLACDTCGPFDRDTKKFYTTGKL